MSSYLSLLRRESTSVVAVELRPPRAELEAAEGMDAWIDTYHAIRSLTRHDVRVMVTDSAVGAQEENNLRHLVANLGDAVGRHKVIPFLTTKHSLEFCLAYADQAVHNGFPSLVVLGGDKHVGRARSLEHAWQLRKLIRERHPNLELGGWANPIADPVRQVDFLLRPDAYADFYLTQIVSHHQARSRRRISRGRPIERAGDARGVRRVLLPQRQREDARDAEPVPAGAGGGAEAGVRGRARRRSMSAREPSDSSSTWVRGTFT